MTKKLDLSMSGVCKLQAHASCCTTGCDCPCHTAPTGSLAWLGELVTPGLAQLVLQLVKATEGLMEVAALAMPDSYFLSDSRTNAAREALQGAYSFGEKPDG